MPSFETNEIVSNITPLIEKLGNKIESSNKKGNQRELIFFSITWLTTAITLCANIALSIYLNKKNEELKYIEMTIQQQRNAYTLFLSSLYPTIQACNPKTQRAMETAIQTTSTHADYIGTFLSEEGRKILRDDVNKFIAICINRKHQIEENKENIDQTATEYLTIRNKLENELTAWLFEKK